MRTTIAELGCLLVLAWCAGMSLAAAAIETTVGTVLFSVLFGVLLVWYLFTLAHWHRWRAYKRTFLDDRMARRRLPLKRKRTCE
jgi:hypothetical protein